MKTSSLRRAVLFLETIVFTILIPGTVTLWIPNALLSPAERALPTAWGATQFAAMLPLCLGGAVYFRCLWEFAARGNGIPAPIDHPKQLVVTGLYRFVRNPMYVGVLLILIGEILFLESRTLVLYAIGWFAFIHLNVLVHEEPVLRHKFGESYARYCSAVRRWIPRRHAF